ncbi:MAG: DUF1643 domain-containing protein [Magnetococcales bacterium]|nr:DUF1643 domain-containing protein [Magnetococcales bacterium]
MAEMEEDQARALRAVELLAMYGVYGHFYDLSWQRSLFRCRSLLELVARDRLPERREDLLQCRPDLLVVMMNPGSSRPLVAGYVPPLIADRVPSLADYRFVATRPDTTQYQIMRVLAARGWGHARVLNLSDLREPKSPLLFQKMAAMVQGDLPAASHSIFFPQRRRELLSLIGPSATIPVIAGWGRHPILLPLAEQALDALRGRRLIGVPAAGERRLYAHPSPMLQRQKEAWLENVLRQLDDLSAARPVV